MDALAAKPKRRLLVRARRGRARAHAGCASLGGLRQPDPGRRASAPPTAATRRSSSAVPAATSRSGGAAVRLHARVFNPNPFGLTLSTLAGDLYLEGDRAAAVDFPIGLPLVANGESEIPIDFAVGFEDVPRTGPGRSAAPSPAHALEYRLDGRIGVDAGALGRPTFGPMTILEGDVRVRR